METKALNRAVKRNRSRFPADFMFRPTREEVAGLRCQIDTSKLSGGASSSRAVAARARGGRRSLPYAFMEQGVAMLSSVLRSRRAVRVKWRRR